jgi:hypothetical protein
MGECNLRLGDYDQDRALSRAAIKTIRARVMSEYLPRGSIQRGGEIL